MSVSDKSHYARPIGLDEEIMRKRGARIGSSALASAIIDRFGYGFGEAPSRAAASFKWRPLSQPTLSSSRSSMA